jgi:hypothetical protein
MPTPTDGTTMKVNANTGTSKPHGSQPRTADCE